MKELSILLESDLRSAQTFSSQTLNETPVQSRESLANQLTQLTPRHNIVIMHDRKGHQINPL